ncbi:LuxR C-terminal-related transcriptional regulator [Nitrospirillum viridazoti]|uniref:LuxR family two component transcriptional regulator n=1 Tax=Nitrospirillum amazonense TaxID=28077 RepID=A0A560IT76_9PROT|nr:response regulator transcription factor [Nitrospirillum amazonense]TWB62273.1 LuxR family two component transcriptional regulator [Nitrospirillum amazonense]
MATHDVLVIDPSTLFRQGLRQLLPQDFRVVSEARDVEAARAELSAPTPNDISGAKLSGRGIALVLFDVTDAGEFRAAASQLHTLFPEARLVYLTNGFDAPRLRMALEAGIDGYLTKDRSSNALIQSLHLVMLGEKVFPSDLALLLTQQNHTGSVGAGSPHKGLSMRETQILRALVKGESNKVIANGLHITEATVKVHLKSLLRKINCNNRTQAAIWALNNGLTEATPTAGAA